MGKWYKQGFSDALDNICDPPMMPGNASHTHYMEGWTDGERQQAADVEREDAASREQDWTCPTTSRNDDDLTGCGHKFKAEPDREGWVDCPSCGLAFNREGEGA